MRMVYSWVYHVISFLRLQQRRMLKFSPFAPELSSTRAGRAGPDTRPLAAFSDIARGNRPRQWLPGRSLGGDLHDEFSNGAECRRGSSNQYHRSLSSDQCRFARCRRLGFATEGEWNQIQRWAHRDSVRHPAQQSLECWNLRQGMSLVVTNSLQAIVFRAGRGLRARPIVISRSAEKKLLWKQEKPFGADSFVCKAKERHFEIFEFSSVKHITYCNEQPNKSWQEIYNLLQHSRSGDMLCWKVRQGLMTSTPLVQHGALCGQVLGPLRDFLKRNLEKCWNSACSGPFGSAW